MLLVPLIPFGEIANSRGVFFVTLQIRLTERKVKLEKYIRTVEMFQGTGQEIESKFMGIMSFVSVEIIVTDLDSVRDQLQHVQVSTLLTNLRSCNSSFGRHCFD